METDALRDPDPVRRRDAIGRVRFRDLKDPDVLRAILDACRDTTPSPGASSEDPFAAFFTSGVAGGTLGDVAAERLAKTGLPSDAASGGVLRAALDADGPAGRLPSVVARALGETRWHDPEGALAALVPALDRHDEPLFGAIVALPSAVLPVLASLAAAPLRLRLLQELLNHPPSRPLAVAAVERAFRDHPPSEDRALAVLAVLAAWSDPAVARIAGGLVDRYRWVVAWQALEDPAALPALRAWLDDDPRPDVLARVSEVLRQRELPPSFPLAAWIRAAGAEHGLVRAFGVDDGVAGVLLGWVRDLADGVGTADRAWTAVTLLGGRVGPELLARLPDPPWDADVLLAYGRAGLADPILAGLGRGEAAVAVPALLALGDDTIRTAVERLLARAEAIAPSVERLGRGTVREVRRGVDTDAWRPLVERLGDRSLSARLDAVSPVVRAE